MSDDVRSLADQLRAHVALRAHVEPEALTPALPLGGGGLGLDSVSLVDLLLGCERLCGRELIADFLRAGTLTYGALERAVTVSARAPDAG